MAGSNLTQLVHPVAGGHRSPEQLLGHADRLALPAASRRRGAAVGAAGGALGGALVDVGISDQDMKRQANEALKLSARRASSCSSAR